MKKKTISLFILIVLLLGLSFPAYADFYDIGKLCKIQIREDGIHGVNGWVFIKPCSNWTSKAGNNDSWIQFDFGRGGASTAMYYTALKAFEMDADVQVRVDENNNSRSYDVTTVITIIK